MIKESIKELISAIAEGDTLAIEDSFNTVMSYKIADRLDSMRVDVAQSMFGSVVEESVELDESAINAAKKENPDLFPKDSESLSDYKKRMSDKRIASSEKNKAFIKKTFTKEEVTEEYTLEDFSVEELEDYMMSEEFKQLDELSKATLGSYVKKATTSAIVSGEALGKGEKWSKSGQIASKREKGIGKAVDKMTKEDLDEESDPTGVKMYHTDKSGKTGSHIVFTSQDANRLHSQIKKAGGKVTHHALMFGTKEGEKKAVSK